MSRRLTTKYIQMLARALPLATLAFFIISCLPEPLEVQRIPAVKPDLVVSSQIIPDGNLVVLLTRTIGALDASDDSDPEDLLNQIAVNDARVILLGPDASDTLVFLGSGVYAGYGVGFEVGENYSLHIVSPELGEATATTDVRRKIDFKDVKASLYDNGYGDTLAQVTYSLVDPPEANWYMVNVQEIELEQVIDNLLNPRAYTVLLTDNGFNGNSYGERFVVFPTEYHTGDTIAVSLSNISEDYYRFLQLRIDNRFNLVEFIGEPVNYPSNVVGGRGYFNLYLPDVHFFVLE